MEANKHIQLHNVEVILTTINTQKKTQNYSLLVTTSHLYIVAHIPKQCTMQKGTAILNNHPE